MSTDREQLIEEAAKAIHADYTARYAEEPPVYHAGIGQPVWRHIARAALAVFEKAHTPANVSRSAGTDISVDQISVHTPTDDEREAPEAPVWLDADEAYAWQSGWSSGWAARRTVQGEPSCVCTSAIAGISDGPNVDCPLHGAVQDRKGAF